MESRHSAVDFGALRDIANDDEKGEQNAGA